MHSWVIFSVVAMAGLVVFLWPAKRRSWLVAGPATLVALATAGVLWILSWHVAGLPRAATPIPDQDALVYKVLATSDSQAFVASDDLLRISLPDGRIEARYPRGDLVPTGFGVLTSVAAGKGVVVFTFHNGPDRAGWAAIREDGWLVEPQFPEWLNANTSAYWDGERGRFMLATCMRSEFGYSEGERRPINWQPVEMRSVGLDGKIQEEPSLRVASAVAGCDGMCLVGGSRYLVDFGGRVCRIEEGEGEFLECRSFEGGQKRRIECPGHVFGLAPHAYLAEDGTRPVPMPPKEFFDRQAPTPSHAFVFLEEEGVRPRFVWYTKRGGLVTALEEGFFSAQFVGEELAREFGHVEHETLLELWDGAGERIAHIHIRRMNLPVLIFEAGDEIVVLDGNLASRVRLDSETLVRLDDPGPVQAARDRLSVWGGHSTLFEGCLVFGLFGVLVVLLLLLAQIARVVRQAKLMALQRVALVYLLIAVPTLLELISRIWHL